MLSSARGRVCLHDHFKKGLEAAGYQRSKMTVCSSAETVLPATFRRLIARKVGPSFRSVAEIEDVLLEQPSRNQVHSNYFGESFCHPL